MNVFRPAYSDGSANCACAVSLTVWLNGKKLGVMVPSGLVGPLRWAQPCTIRIPQARGSPPGSGEERLHLAARDSKFTSSCRKMARRIFKLISLFCPPSGFFPYFQSWFLVGKIISRESGGTTSEKKKKHTHTPQDTDGLSVSHLCET